MQIKKSISVPLFNEFKAHDNKDDKFCKIKLFACIFRKNF